MSSLPLLRSLPVPPVAAPTPTPEAAHRAEADRLPDLVRMLYGQAGVALAGHLLGAVIVLVAFHGVAPRSLLWSWGLLFAALWSFRVASVLAYQRRIGHAPLPAADCSRWQDVWNASALATGALWGSAGWLFYGEGRAFHQAALLLILYSYCVGAISLLASHYRIYLVFTLLCFLPVTLRVAWPGSPDALGLATVLALVLCMTLLLARSYRRVFDHAISLKVATERLAAQLQVEKSAAEDARRVAETASRAKTQFFAAASHDLRQPLHAMGLFAEALRARSRGDVEVTRLVNSINDSVDALDGLFGELLDITRLDSGAVQVKPADFGLRTLFQRLRLASEPAAFEKGLSLRFRGERHAVHADPLLVERILRNLLANAVRYSTEGGVLVAARRRANSMLLQVWDSGVGIAAGEQDRIFDEFYQVEGRAPLAAHEAKGLGLGLAIVQRLAHLLQAPLTLASVPGRGSVFTLTLPLARESASLPAPPSAYAALALQLEHRLIVVVEDELLVREGLTVLLESWGASVVALESVAAVEAWLRDTPLRPTPDLAILDYRLPQGRSGLEALALLRSASSTPLPAIMVTGSSLGGHEEEAGRHDFHLLVKPVAPNKLRAMIAFKLGTQDRSRSAEEAVGLRAAPAPG